MNYIVTVKEVLSRRVLVKAEDEVAAVDKIQQLYREGGVILDYHDYSYTEIDDREEADRDLHSYNWNQDTRTDTERISDILQGLVQVYKEEGYAPALTDSMHLVVPRKSDGERINIFFQEGDDGTLIRTCAEDNEEDFRIGQGIRALAHKIIERYE